MDDTSLRHHIPDSVLPYPRETWNRVKYLFWRTAYPLHHSLRDGMLALGIIHHEGRQNYSLGKIAPGKTAESLLRHLETEGFGNDFIAWKDDGEIAGIRKLEGFERQYHLRIFKDGEVRGHYEFTPESHPIWHQMERGIEERRSIFQGFLDDQVT